MAYPAVLAPYGLIPINLIGGQVFAGSTRNFPIASAYATSIFFGDVVKLVAGNVEKDVGTATATPVGVFLGVSFTDPVFGKTFRQSYPANTVASDIQAVVCDDPDTLFKIAVATAGSPPVIATVTAAAVGKNVALVQNAGNPATGNSAVSVGATPAVTATLPLRIIDVIAESALTPGNFTEVIVKWNQGMHAYLNPLGA